MKRLFAIIFALISSIAFGATTVPVQLLNPTGSSSGQTIVSTGASSAPGWSTVGLSGLTAIAANTVVANATGSSAAPTAFAMPSCSANGSTLLWTAGTGFTCTTLSRVQAVNTSGQSISNNSATTTTNWTVSNQVGSAFVGSTGVYTTPATGYYEISFQLEYDLTTPPIGTQLLTAITVAGTTVANGITTIASTSQTKAASQVTAIVKLTVGQTVTFQAYQNSGAAVTLDTGAANIYLSIQQLP